MQGNQESTTCGVSEEDASSVACIQPQDTELPGEKLVVAAAELVSEPFNSAATNVFSETYIALTVDCAFSIFWVIC